ncbi:Major facilitator superfamily domain-containing protein 1, partial [Cichlidogyrus casuarinus]
MKIGSVDIKTTEALQRREKRKSTQPTVAPEPERVPLSELLSSPSTSSNSSAPYVPRNMRQLPKLCQVLERYDISNEAICKAINTYLEEIDLLDGTIALERNKIARQRKKHRQAAILANQADALGMTVLGFDGRTDSTMISNGVFEKEEHVSVVAFPGERDLSVELLGVVDATGSRTTLQ